MSGEGKHTARFYVEVEPEFGYGDKVIGVKATKMTQGKPALKPGSFCMKVGITLDDAMWNRIVPEAIIEVPVERTGSVDVEVEPAPVDLGPDHANVGEDA